MQLNRSCTSSFVKLWFMVSSAEILVAVSVLDEPVGSALFASLSGHRSALTAIGANQRHDVVVAVDILVEQVGVPQAEASVLVGRHDCPLRQFFGPLVVTSAGTGSDD